MHDSSSSTDPASVFFHEVVEPTVAEFMTDRANKRRGCLACLALSSMIEHYAHARFGDGMDRTKFASSIRETHKPLAWVADVANATKHVVRFKKHKKIGFDDIQSLELGRFGVLRCGWPIGGEEVLIGLEHEWRLSELIEYTMNFWRDELNLRSRVDEL